MITYLPLPPAQTDEVKRPFPAAEVKLLLGNELARLAQKQQSPAQVSEASEPVVHPQAV